jgi:hypothetical protein
VKNLVTCLTLSLAFILLAISELQAQDSISAHNSEYVLLFAARGNWAAPGYSNFNNELEAGIKELMAKNKIPVLKNKKEATEKGLSDCQILKCTFSISYATGLMLNARIECSLSFTDCNKREIYTVSAKKMTGAVAGLHSYMKLFTKMIKQNMKEHLIIK